MCKVAAGGRWDVDTGGFEMVAPNKRFGSFVDGVELFDNAFFSVAQPEAVAMDAQQRILLEASYEALQFSAPRELTGVWSVKGGPFRSLCSALLAGCRSGADTILQR